MVGQLFVGWLNLAVDFVLELMFVYTTPLSARRYRLDSQSDKVSVVEVYSCIRDWTCKVNRRMQL